MDHDIVTPEDDLPVEGKAKKNGDVSAAAETMATRDDKTILEYFGHLHGAPSLQVKIKRLQPRTWRGKQVGGVLDTLSELIDEHEIQERYGGGRYEIRVLKPGVKGNMVFAGQRTIDIAGNPRLDGALFEDTSIDGGIIKESSEESSLQKHAMGIAERMALEERKRADKMEDRILGQSGFDTEAIKLFTEPLQRQIESANTAQTELRKQLDERNREVLELISKKPEPSSMDRLAEKMLLEEQSRMLSVRTAHEAELRTARESNHQDHKRAEDRADRLLEQNERAHQREIDSLKRAYEGQNDNLKVSYEARIETLRSELNRYVKDYEATRTELASLRDKKEQPIEEQLSRLLQLKELFGSLQGDDEEGSWTDKLLNGVTPILDGIGQRIATGPGLPPGTQAPQVVAPQQPMAQAQPGQPGQPQAVKQVAVSAAELATAVAYIEAAISNNTDPADFAKSVIGIVPKPLLEVMKTQGVESLIQAVVQSNAASPIVTQAGRFFLKKVAKALVEIEKNTT